MGFYDLSATERAQKASQIYNAIMQDIASKGQIQLLNYFGDEDTYIRKNAYLAIGKIYNEHLELRTTLIERLNQLLQHPHYHIRQTVLNAAGEIGKYNFTQTEHFFDIGLFDPHHTVRNAVIGSIKKMGEKNPEPILQWARKYLHHPDKEIRREICHGIELRGRTHPQDVLPLLKELQFDKTARVRNTLVHVIGQIAYKKGCLATVIADLNQWENRTLVKAAIDEIIDVHHRYRNFAVFSQEEAIAYLAANALP
jgi:HEAT repeat protein